MSPLDTGVQLRILVASPRQHGFGLNSERIAAMFGIPVWMLGAGPRPGSQTRTARRAERRRVALLLRQQRRDASIEARIKRVHAAITRGDSFARGGSHHHPTLRSTS